MDPPALSSQMNEAHILKIQQKIFIQHKSICMQDVKVVVGNPFSLTTTPRCRGECYFFLLIAPLYN